MALPMELVPAMIFFDDVELPWHALQQPSDAKFPNMSSPFLAKNYRPYNSPISRTATSASTHQSAAAKTEERYESAAPEEFNQNGDCGREPSFHASKRSSFKRTRHSFNMNDVDETTSSKNMRSDENMKTASSILEAVLGSTAAPSIETNYYHGAQAQYYGAQCSGRAAVIPSPAFAESSLVDLHAKLFYGEFGSGFPGGAAFKETPKVVSSNVATPKALGVSTKCSFLDTSPPRQPSSRLSLRSSKGGEALAPPLLPVSMGGSASTRGPKNTAIQPRSMREKCRRHKILAAFSKLEDSIPSSFCRNQRAAYTRMDTCTLILMSIRYIKSLEAIRNDLAQLCVNQVANGQ